MVWFSPSHVSARGKLVALAMAGLGALSPVAAVGAQATPPSAPASTTPIELIALSVGRALPLDFTSAVTQVTVANPGVADVVVLNERSVVLNAKALGETDVLLSGPAFGRRHLRVSVNQATEQRQIALGVKFAEVRKDALLELGVSGSYKSVNGSTDAGTGVLAPGASTSTGANRFLGALLNFGTQDITAFLDAQQQAGRARSLAEPTLIAGNREEATFLAGGELPIPVVQPGQGGQIFVVIQYRPYGVQLKFRGEVMSDSLIKLKVTPEVSTLDFTNAVLLSGFRIPAIRTRRVETTLDVRPGESLVISGLFNEERESIRTGVPGLMSLPIIGALFSSNRWQKNESELLVVVSPELFDPNVARSGRTLRFKPDSTMPAADAIKKRLPPE
ncbi:type II and III secretion system protein family protein [Gemmatimonas phototrophica]|uniref:type II and III secretion system protein family protein n=1 Tax=Gemmatimonas phototrophica TaxID=1379270 RepID=UPI0006A6D028|nr:pilus assembly protein N-terminal domain-containing protein [Gemmatimonas phototrophica]